MYSNSEIQTIHQQGKSILNKRYVTLNGIVYIGIKDGRLKLDKYGNTIADLTTTGTIAGTYGDATNVGQFTVDDKGRITNASNVLIDVGTEDLLATLTIGNTGGGLDIIDVAGLQDSFSIRSIDIENRQLISSTGLVWSLDWENRLICDSNGQYSVDWENRYLQDSALVVKLDWENFSMPTLGGSGAGFVAVDNAGLLSFGTAAPLNHDILSSTHGDTLAGAVVRGDIIVGNATPKWDKLAVGAAGTVLIGGTDPSYSSSPTISVSITSPLIIGGTAVGSSLELRSTSGVGTTDFIKFCVGNNGGTEAMRVLTSGHFLVGATIVSSANESWGFTKNQNSYSYFRVANTTAGTASIAGFFAASDAGAGGVYQMSSIYTSSGIYEADKTIFFGGPTSGGVNVGSVSATPLCFWTNNTKKVEISSVGNMSLGGVAVRGTTVGTYAFQIFNGTAPVGTLANGVSIYSAAGILKVMNATGTAATLDTASVFSTSTTTPIVIGGTAVGSSLELRSTSGVGTTDFIKFCVGNNGGTEAMRVLTSGHFLVGATIVSSANESWGFTKNQNSYSYFRVANTTAGTASIAGFFAASDAGAGGVYQMSSIYTSSGIYEADKTIFFGGPTSGGVNVGSVSATPLCFWTNNTKKVEISSVGNMSLGGVAVRGTTVGTYAFQIFDGTSPVGTLTNGISLYSSGGNVYSMGSTGLVTIPNHAGNMVINKTTGLGIKVDTATPTFGYRDIIGDISTRPAAGGGATAIPDFVAYRGNVYSYRFGTVAPENHLHEAFVVFHIPHDYVAGTDIYIHNHWSQIVADTGGGGAVPGVCKWYFDITYADGYGTAGGAGDPFVAPKTIPVTQQGSTTQYAHMIAEVIISGATDTATTFDRATFQVDGVFMVRIYRDPADAADTLNQHTFLHYSDMHYQSTNIATKDKNSPFYT